MRALPGRASRTSLDQPPAAVTRPGLKADQRRRILRATGELVAIRGHGDVTVEQIVRRARVAFKTFYNHFGSKEECLLELLDETTTRSREQVEASLGGPLPGGHHGLSHEQVLESQRERLLAAFAGELAANGYRHTTINAVAKSASVSSKAFYDSFNSKEECFLAAFDAVLDHLRATVATSVPVELPWARRLIAALRLLLDFFASEPDLARLCLVEPVTATPTIAAHFREAVNGCIPYLWAGRGECPDGASLPDSTEDSLLGGFVVLSSRSVLVGDPLPALLPDLAEFVLAPYLGPERAKELGAAAGRGTS